MMGSVRLWFDQEAARVGAALPRGPRLCIVGSTSFWHGESEATCGHIGRLLADIRGLVLITGGVEGVGEAVGRGYFRAAREAGLEPRVFHVLPDGEEAWDYGETHFAGAEMSERREVLARLAGVYLMVEGGPGTVHEAEVAAARGAVILPVGRSGGHAGGLYPRTSRPAAVDEMTWAVLGSPAATPEAAAVAAVRAVKACLRLGTDG
jgi:predicted Rossmann-fold nucleotide-binding protein